MAEWNAFYHNDNEEEEQEEGEESGGDLKCALMYYQYMIISYD